MKTNPSTLYLPTVKVNNKSSVFSSKEFRIAYILIKTKYYQSVNIFYENIKVQIPNVKF